MTTDLLNKISEYQLALYNKIHQSEYHFTPEEEIQLGDNLYLSGICLGNDKNWFATCYMPVAECSSYISLESLSDLVLVKVLHILRKQI